MNAVERFLKYVTYDTQSDEHSQTTPTTEKQKVFYTILGILNFAFTAITFSRGGILFGALGALLTFAFAVKTNHGKTRLKILLPCVIALVALIAVYIAFMDDVMAIAR